MQNVNYIPQLPHGQHEATNINKDRMLACVLFYFMFYNVTTSTTRFHLKCLDVIKMVGCPRQLYSKPLHIPSTISKGECKVPRFQAQEDTVHTLAWRPTQTPMDGGELLAWHLGLQNWTYIHGSIRACKICRGWVT